MHVRSILVTTFLVILGSAGAASAAVLTFGDKDCLGQNCYGSDPLAGATLQGLAPGATTAATNSFGHTYPFAPGGGEFAGTDQIYVGSVQTGAHDGYSVAAERINGPQVLSLDYSSLVGPGQVITSLTLGIAADDFQSPSGGLFTARINGVISGALSVLLNSIDQGGPQVQFFTLGLGLGDLLPSNVLTVSIDEGGDGGDGWAVDFLTVGVTTREVVATPEPATLALLGAGLLGLAGLRRRRV